MLPRFAITDTPNNSWRRLVFLGKHSFKFTGFYQTKIGIPFFSNFLNFNERQSRVIKVAVRIVAATPVFVKHILALGTGVNVPRVYTKSVVTVVVNVKTLWNLLTSAAFSGLTRSQGIPLLRLKLPAAKDQQKRRTKVLDLSFGPKSLNLVYGFINGPIGRATLAGAKVTVRCGSITIRTVHDAFSVVRMRCGLGPFKRVASLNGPFHFTLEMV